MRLILVIVLLLAACSAPPPPAPFTPPAWTRQAAPTLPYERLENVHGAAGWSGGFVVAGWYGKPAGENSEGRTNDLFPVVHMSADGQTWREVSPPEMSDVAWGDAVAAYGDRAYVLGQNGSIGPVLLTSEGGVWTKVSLPGRVFADNPVSVTAGPRGVVVVGFWRKGSDRAKGLRIWHSADGKKFGEPVELSDSLYTGYLPRVITTDRGFLLYGTVPTKGRPKRHAEMLYESEDGRKWTPAGDALPDLPDNEYYGQITAAQHHNGMTVAFGKVSNNDDPEAQDTGLTGWYRRDGESKWTRLADADIDPGRLPDAGVVPRSQRDVHSVFPWQSGFIALGEARADTAVWTSSDGLKWTKMPVRDNGFEGAARLKFLSDGKLSLMVRSSATGETGTEEGPDRVLAQR